LHADNPVTPVPRLVLASGSPRRRQLLANLGVRFEVIVPEVDEIPVPGEPPSAFVRRVAREKGESVVRQTGGAVLSADTVVAIDARILGKPDNMAAARAMLEALSGREHVVYTAVRLEVVPDAKTFESLDRTRVSFRKIDSDEITDCLGKEDVLDKAGAYAIQGYAGRWVSRIAGNYSNVVGLPLPVTFGLLCRAGLIREKAARKGRLS